MATVIRRRTASAEPVADAADGRERQPVTELGAQLADVDVDRTLVAVPARTPDAVEELRAAESQAGVGGQILEQIELARGQRDNGRTAKDLAASGVDMDVAGGQDRRLDRGSLLGRVTAAQDGIDTGGENGLVT
jgi:hypothetical protein